MNPELETYLQELVDHGIIHPDVKDTIIYLAEEE